jgi:hypothetical protein
MYIFCAASNFKFKYFKKIIIKQQGTYLLQFVKMSPKKDGTALHEHHAGLQKHHDLPKTQMRPFKPSYSDCRKDFEKLTVNLQIYE